MYTEYSDAPHIATLPVTLLGRSDHLSVNPTQAYILLYIQLSSITVVRDEYCMHDMHDNEQNVPRDWPNTTTPQIDYVATTSSGSTSRDRASSSPLVLLFPFLPLLDRHTDQEFLILFLK